MSVRKGYYMECDWCGDARFGENMRELAKWQCVYRWTSVNPVADELYFKEKPIAFKYLEFCCKECADEYFKANPEDVPFYKHWDVKGGGRYESIYNSTPL